MIIVGMSVIATVVVLQYHHHDPTGGKMPKWVRTCAHTVPGVPNTANAFRTFLNARHCVLKAVI